MNVLSLISIGVAAALIAEPFVKSRAAKKRRSKAYENWRTEYRQRAEYNRAHLPSKELPQFSPDWNYVNRLIIETRFQLYDRGDVFLCYEYENRNEYENTSRTIPKSDFDGDTLKLINLIKKDFDWFYGHPTGETVGECMTVLEGFLSDKYPMLPAESISWITNRFGLLAR